MSMADTPESNDEIPAFRISPKKVDDSWKEEMRREREHVAAAAAQAPAAPAAAAAGPGTIENFPPPADGQPQSQIPGEKETGSEPAATPDKAGQMQSKIFMNLLASLAQQTLMQLGEIESPYSGQREFDLRGAKSTIELLGVLQSKTKNNLTAEENEALTEALHDLHQRFVEVTREVQRQMQAQAQKAALAGGRPGR